MKSKLLFCLIMAFFMGLMAQGQVPQTIDFQGRMADSNGDPINGQHTITFSLFSSETGGSALWAETREVTFANGLFHVALGEGSPIPASVLMGGTPWLQIAIGAEVLSPRTRLNSAPFARVAQNVVGGSADVTQVSIAGMTVINQQGQWVGEAVTPAPHQHSANDITSGIFSVPRGGTGISSYAVGNYLRASGATTLQQRTPSEVRSDIGAAAATHSHSASEITTGTLPVARGGTGRASLTSGKVLVGSGTDALLMPTNLHWDNTNSRLGIGTTSPSALLHTHSTGTGGGNVLFVGSYKLTNPGDPPTQGSGTRMMWYPDKAAFRAGHVEGMHWHKDSIGNYSFASGFNTVAKGFASTAMGWNTTASGLYSTAMGRNTTASGLYSTAMGANTAASGLYSTAMGANTAASGEGAIATGGYTEALGFRSTAMGSVTIASGTASTAMGRQARAVGDHSFAINLSTTIGPEVGERQFRISGALSIGGNLAWTNHSDSRLKIEIQHLESENNLEKIMKLNGIRFKWKESNPGNDRYYLGFLAQDVLEVMPEPVLHDELNDIYSMEYTAIIPVLVEGIKEQQAIIELQQSLIEELLKRVEKLEGK